MTKFALHAFMSLRPARIILGYNGEMSSHPNEITAHGASENGTGKHKDFVSALQLIGGIQYVAGEKGPALITSRRYFICCLFALTLSFSGGWIVNAYIFPLFDPIFSWARETSTGVNGLTLIFIALFATWRPSIFNEKVFVLSAVIGILTGVPVLMYGVSSHSIVLLVLGSSLLSIGRGLIVAMVGVSCIDMERREAGICITLAYLFSFLSRSLFVILPDIVGIVAYAAFPLIALALVYTYLYPILNHVFKAEPPAQMAVTKPSSFLPFGHQLFICIVLFRFVHGYALTLGEIGGVPLSTVYAIIPLTLVAFSAVVSKKSLNPDMLFRVSALFVVAGFLVLPIHTLNANALVNTLLFSGVGCFEILTYFVLIALGSRNRASSLAVFAWGYAMNSLGVILGANFGRFTNAYLQIDLATVQVLAALVIFAFVAYILTVLKDFNFNTTIEGVTPSETVVSSFSAGLLEARCKTLSAKFALTSRESEIFALLARGRNSRFIQEELFVSYNTVKAHVRHIYSKLGIHTQQELIDLVESDEG